MNIITIYEIVGLCLTVLSTIAAYVKSGADAKKQNAALVSLIGVMFTMLVAMRFDTLPKIENTLEWRRSYRRIRIYFPLERR